MKPLRRYELHLVDLDPTQGSEDRTFQRKRGQVVLDQITTGHDSRLVKPLGAIPGARACEVAGLLQDMFAYGD